MKKKVICIVAICVVIAVAISALFVIRKINNNNGKEQGYILGYSIGYTDGHCGEIQNSQDLAGSIVPYEVGSAKWKGFMMGFSEGYSNGYGSSTEIAIDTIPVEVKYIRNADGTWERNGIVYKYLLEITGRMPNADADITFVYLSNLESISFEQAWKAAGYSSNSADYFAVEDAVLVETITH